MLEPINLFIVESVVDLNRIAGPIFVLDRHGDRFSRSQLIQTLVTDPVFGLDLIVIGFICQREGQDGLLLQIGLKDSSVRISYKRAASHMAWFHCRMLTTGTLADIFIGKRDPTQALVSQVTSDFIELLVFFPGYRVVA